LESPRFALICALIRSFEAVLEANLSDLQVFYFGANGEPGAGS